jgi:hypothetical protein
MERAKNPGIPLTMKGDGKKQRGGRRSREGKEKEGGRKAK